MSTRRVGFARLHGVVKSSLVVTFAAAAVAGGFTPGAAVAEPLNAAAAADSIGTTEPQRIAAAGLVGLDPTPDVLLLSDYSFIRALWQKANGAGEKRTAVRTAAEEAMASDSAEDHVRFIITGIFDADKLDAKREQDRAEAERAAQFAKSQALLAVGIPSSPELLELSDDNFILAIAERAAGPEVRAAARRALAGDASVRREFIVNGAREAHQRDLANKLKESEEKDRAEAARLRERGARTKTAALFGVEATEPMLALGDDNFIRELLRLAPGDLHNSQLYTAAQRAVTSSDPAGWKTFILIGAEEAYKRDDAARLEKLNEANRQLVRQIQGAAERGGVHPQLVAAARKVLAGSPKDVANFLEEGTQRRLKRQSLQMTDPKASGWYARQSGADGGKAFVTPVDSQSPRPDREDATWVIVPSLVGRPGCFSFESVRKPGSYLMAEKDLRVKMAGDDRTADFRNRATWCARKGLTGSGTTSFVWGERSEERWLRHLSGELFASQYYDARTTGQTASWKIAPPLAP
ncbi:AbfB domain-containing protein [Streptomyces luteireticuli]|uniref:AbfB domain-containing protein n=1 Tax=Streptomyces luteireticuli TaxID=173858 RepID=UPI00355888E1